MLRCMFLFSIFVFDLEFQDVMLEVALRRLKRLQTKYQ